FKGPRILVHGAAPNGRSRRCSRPIARLVRRIGARSWRCTECTWRAANRRAPSRSSIRRSRMVCRRRSGCTCSMPPQAWTSPTARANGLEGALWEALAPGRLTMARLLLSRGDALAAHRLASFIDQPEVLIHQLFLALSLAIRLDAARALHDRALEQVVQSRLT